MKLNIIPWKYSNLIKKELMKNINKFCKYQGNYKTLREDMAKLDYYDYITNHYQQLKSLGIDIQKHSAIFVNYTT